MSQTTSYLSALKAKAYTWSGFGLLVLGIGSGVLNATLAVPDYQKVSWLLVGFFVVSGVAAVGVGRNAIPAGGKIVEYGEALVVAVLLAIAIRGVAVQAFKIPSGSMLPTLLIGDHLLVSKFLYGIRLPYTSQRLFELRPPQRGDIVVFAYPVDDSKDFIKRVIGEPGDRLEMRDKVLFINGERFEDPWGVHEDPTVLPEGVEKRDNFGVITVPAGQYFVMGDNRDRSYDSRFWGFVEAPRIRGKAFIMYWSWDAGRTLPRLNRIGHWIR
ncbi:MAG: signal peptidase I [Desulfuromonadales bacterium]|nr:signal peptidase I [Desulfuromonadales bacterium]